MKEKAAQYNNLKARKEKFGLFCPGESAKAD